MKDAMSRKHNAPVRFVAGRTGDVRRDFDGLAS